MMSFRCHMTPWLGPPSLGPSLQGSLALLQDRQQRGSCPLVPFKHLVFVVNAREGVERADLNLVVMRLEV